MVDNINYEYYCLVSAAGKDVEDMNTGANNNKNTVQIENLNLSRVQRTFNTAALYWLDKAEFPFADFLHTCTMLMMRPDFNKDDASFILKWVDQQRRNNSSNLYKTLRRANVETKDLASAKKLLSTRLELRIKNKMFSAPVAAQPLSTVAVIHQKQKIADAKIIRAAKAQMKKAVKAKVVKAKKVASSKTLKVKNVKSIKAKSVKAKVVKTKKLVRNKVKIKIAKKMVLKKNQKNIKKVIAKTRKLALLKRVKAPMRKAVAVRSSLRNKTKKKRLA